MRGKSAAPAAFLWATTAVGYTTIDAPAAGKYKALSVAFDNVGSEKSFPIATLISCDAPKGGASALTTADQIWLWDTAEGDWVKSPSL